MSGKTSSTCRQVDEEEDIRRLEVVKAMLDDGLSKREMAKRLGCSKRSVYNDLARLHRERSTAMCPYCGSRRTTNAEKPS